MGHMDLKRIIQLMYNFPDQLGMSLMLKSFGIQVIQSLYAVE